MNQPNPAWKPLLDKLPPALHASILPVLEQWDKGVQDKFAEIREEYKPYEAFKPFIENNITPEFAWESVVFADQLQQNPSKVVEQIKEAFPDQVKFVDQATHEQALAEAAKASSTDDGDLFEAEDGKVDLSKIPEFTQMQQTLQKMQESEEEKRRREAEEAELEEFNAELDALEEKVTKPKDGSAPKPFNRTVITAFMSQGLDGDEAVKQFHLLLGGNADTPENTDNTDANGAPVTMGNGGNVGSGTDDGSVDYNSMTTSEFNQNVAKILEAQLGQNSS